MSQVAAKAPLADLSSDPGDDLSSDPGDDLSSDPGDDLSSNPRDDRESERAELRRPMAATAPSHETTTARATPPPAPPPTTPTAPAEQRPSELTTEQRLRLGAAMELSKVGQGERGLSQLQALYSEVPAAPVGRALVTSLRKLGRLDDAAERLDELRVAYPEDGRLAAEGGYLRIARELEPYAAQGLVNNAALCAREIASSTTDAIVRRKAVFLAIRAAKQKKAWPIIGDLCQLLDPDTLGTRPYGKDKKGWSDRARWYAARVASLLETRRPDEALPLAEKAAACFPDQRVFFERWQARAAVLLGRLDDALVLYEKLSRRRRPDWWALHEHGELLALRGEGERALALLCRAACGVQRIEMGVRLLAALAELACERDDARLAAETAALTIELRNKNGWRVPEALTAILAQTATPETTAQIDWRARLARCRTLWRKQAGIKEPESAAAASSGSTTRDGDASAEDAQAARIGPLEGRLRHPDVERPFCFIRVGKEMLFCLAGDLAPGLVDGDRVRLHKVPSFDKKKNRESWRAVDVLPAGRDEAGGR